MLRIDEIDHESRGHQVPWIAKRDNAIRSNNALSEYPDFFESDEHQDKIAKVFDICDKFFKENRGIYVNHRANSGRGKPFTTVKVFHPQFPNHLSQAAKSAQFYDPLEELGVEVKFVTNSNSYLIKIT